MFLFFGHPIQGHCLLNINILPTASVLLKPYMKYSSCFCLCSTSFYSPPNMSLTQSPSSTLLLDSSHTSSTTLFSYFPCYLNSLFAHFPSPQPHTQLLLLQIVFIHLLPRNSISRRSCVVYLAIDILKLCNCDPEFPCYCISSEKNRGGVFIVLVYKQRRQGHQDTYWC